MGKTSLAHVVARFLESRGGDATLGGVSYQQLAGFQVRSRVGYVDDAPHVFATTLGANLRVARPDATDDEVRTALRAAGLAPLLSTLPEGLDTELGGATTGLSGGERRRLGVAREFLSGRPVMILDEPTEGLDEPEAAELMREVRRHQSSTVVVVISHQYLDHVGATSRLTVSDGAVREVIVK